MNDQRFAETISKIAHELRSPLTSIKGFSATLVSKWDRFHDEQKRQFVEAINIDAERMSRIIGEVLDLARLEAGRLELNVMTVRMADVACKAAARLEQQPGSERIKVDVEPGARVEADPHHLENVLTHLLENGIKFSEDGEVVVRSSDHGDRLQVSVTDSGEGITPGRVTTLFDGPSPPGGSHTPRGSGLGLYLSRRLVEIHGGSMTVTSEEGRGSVFIVELPTGSR